MSPMTDTDTILFLLRWALLMLGLIYLATESTIFALPRMVLVNRHVAWATLLYCPACMGFWLGLLTGWLDLWPFPGVAAIQSGIAGVAVGALWGHIHPNPAHENELAIVDIVEGKGVEDDPEETSKDE